MTSAGTVERVTDDDGREAPVAAASTREAAPAPSDVSETSSLGRARPGGLTPGGFAFFGSWAVGFAVARLTGAAAVVLLLVVGFVGLIAASLAGWWRLRAITSLAGSGPSRADVDTEVSIRVTLDDQSAGRAPLTMSIGTGARPRSPATTGTGTFTEGPEPIAVPVDVAGTLRTFSGWIGTTGTGGLVWWRRPFRLSVDPIRVAPRSAGPLLEVERIPASLDGSSVGGRGRRTGDVDGIRLWRSGESDQAIHWPSTIRSGQIVAFDRESAVETSWIVPLDGDPGRLRWTLEEGLRHGHAVSVVGHDLTAPVEVRTTDEAADWATVSADLAPTSTASDHEPPTPVWKRPLFLAGRVAEPPAVRPSARWLTALTAVIAVNMLLGALGDSVATRAMATVGVLVGAAVSVRFRNGIAPTSVRSLVALLSIGALARIALQTSGIGGLIEALRGPMPDLLMVLLVLHGAESANRRTARVHLAITAVIVAYSAGLRIDDRVGWWLLAWGVALIASVTALTTERDAPRRSTDIRTSAQRSGRTVGWSALALIVSFAIASLVPVPDGPASLGLPAISNNDVRLDDPGALAGPDGSQTPPDAVTPASETPDRGSLGQVGGYPGFSETLDTSVRGGLGDEVVMRVRAPEPAFWRGQTFTEFDGRTWRVSDVEGRLTPGPQIFVPPSIGDLPLADVPTEEFVQTYHVETDLPNIVFAAARAETVIFDGAISTRPDGALRADRTLTDGTIYTVVSRRVEVTPELLRRQGDLASRFAAISEPAGTQLLAPYLALPDSTTARTIELAERLRVDGSTYDTVLAYEDWLAINTEYDLNAPVPAAGADAVDDYLFESRRGFCEQIASALVVMLRSQGVPARMATGYIPGERDQVSGVWKVRASDAHAWVEVWFPETGWQAFDPTASVPLAGETSPSTVGDDVASAVIGAVTSRPVETGAIAVLVLGALGATRMVRELRRRRARGPWGLLYDRFVTLATDGAEDDSINAPRAAARIADRLGDDAAAPDPSEVATLLDRVAFDPSFTPRADDLSATRSAITTLERTLRHP